MPSKQINVDILTEEMPDVDESLLVEIIGLAIKKITDILLKNTEPISASLGGKDYQGKVSPVNDGCRKHGANGCMRFRLEITAINKAYSRVPQFTTEFCGRK